MNTVEIIEMVVVILLVITYAFMLFFKVKGNVLGIVSELIALAEETNLVGSAKMAQVVDGLYEMVPVFLKKILSKERLEKIAQRVFDWMRRYANKYIEASKENGGVNDDMVHAIEAEAIAELVSEMIGMTVTALKDKAEECGIELDGKETKKDIIEAIVIAVLKKA